MRREIIPDYNITRPECWKKNIAEISLENFFICGSIDSTSFFQRKSNSRCGDSA